MGIGVLAHNEASRLPVLIASLFEQSLHSITWLVSGYGLYRRNRRQLVPIISPGKGGG